MKTIKEVLKGLILFALMILLLIVVSLFPSCTSKSGQLDKRPYEKVVILDSYITSPGQMYKYKVRRIEKGVVDITYNVNKYEAGDTIYAKYLN